MQIVFIEHRFRKAVQNALVSVDRILDMNRNPHLAENVDHTYTNKYDLANFVTNIAIISILNIFEQIGLTTDILQSIHKNNNNNNNNIKSEAITLRFQTHESFHLLKEQTVAVPMNHSTETNEMIETTGSFTGNTKKSSISRVINHVKEYHWKVDVTWEVFLFPGNNVEEGKTIMQSRKSSQVIITQSDHLKRPINSPYHHIDISLMWLLNVIDVQNLTTNFKIDTQNPQTKTPRRNQNIKDAIDFLNRLYNWCSHSKRYFKHNIERDILRQHNPAIGYTDSKTHSIESLLPLRNCFCPIQPLMEELTNQESNEITKTNNTDQISYSKFDTNLIQDLEINGSPLLSQNDMNKLLNEQLRTITQVTTSLNKSYPSKESTNIISITEANFFFVCQHAQDLAFQYIQSMDYIENMLKKQMIAAIGKSVTSEDLDQFIKFHNANLLNPPPQPFCHSIRRPHHFPDGLLSIEKRNVDGKMEPIETIVRHVDSTLPLQVPLNAATILELTGKTYLHGWLQHRFQESKQNTFQLSARARQFSSFILMIGTMAGPNRLSPKDAIILQNKDEVLIPLLLNELPTPKDFKDAIESLSPEQQRFAKAFRRMQLESSVFGVCVIQIKPQLEALLGLPEDSLTKEMKLTQDLMELFVEHQVPSDLLSYDGPEESTNVKDKVANVKGHVKAVMEVINGVKNEQLEEASKKAEMDEQMWRPSMRPVFCAMATSPSSSPAYSPSSPAYSPCFSPPSSPAYSPCFSPPSSPTPPVFMAKNVSSQACKASLTTTCPTTKSSENNNSVVPLASKEESNEKSSESKANNEDHHRNTKKRSIDMMNYSMIPKLIDAKIAMYDSDNALKSTIIKSGNDWTRKRQKNLLTQLKISSLSKQDIETERNKTMDLLDSLSRSGSFPISYTELHVIVGLTHCFENNIMGTIIQDNINPIEKLEKSTLLLASSIYDGIVPVNHLVQDPNELERLIGTFPALLDSSDSSKIETPNQETVIEQSDC